MFVWQGVGLYTLVVRSNERGVPEILVRGLIVII